MWTLWTNVATIIGGAVPVLLGLRWVLHRAAGEITDSLLSKSEDFQELTQKVKDIDTAVHRLEKLMVHFIKAVRYK